MRWIPAGILMVVLPNAAFAAEWRTGDLVVVGQDEIIDDDLYISGGTVRIHGSVTGNLVVAGGNVVVTGPIGGDVMLATGNGELSGPVEGAVRAAGGTLIFGGAIDDDLVATGGRLIVPPQAEIGRDVWVSGGSATIDGLVGGDVGAATGELVVGGQVAGDVTARNSQVRLTPDAVIAGDLAGGRPTQVAEGAQVAGTVDEAPARPIGAVVGLWLFQWARTFVGLFLAGALLLLVLPRLFTAANAELAANPGRSVGYGFAALVGLPLAAATAFVVGALVGGWWIGLVLLGLLVIAAIAGFETGGLYVGRRILRWLGTPEAKPVAALAVGLAALTLIGSIPFFGAIVVFVAVVLGLGAMVLAGVHARSPVKPLSP